jgi:hypothetical protein
MRPYKRLFKESDIVDYVEDEYEAEQIVDISNLKWLPYGQVTEGHWDKFIGSTSDYRLPTIQELYTAYKQNVRGFDNSEIYWSSSTTPNNKDYAWTLDFYNGNIGVSNKYEAYWFARLVTNIIKGKRI